MKHLKIYLAAICCLFSFQASWGQTYKYPLDNGNSSDYSTINGCVDYVRKNYIPHGEQTVNHFEKYYKFPNNRGIVVTSFDLSHKEKYDLKSDNEYFDPWTGWHKAESITYTKNSSRTYAVFVNENGFPSSAVLVWDRFDINLLDNKVLFLKGYTSIDKDNNYARSYVFREIYCYNYDGSISWSSDNQMVIMDYALTNNNLYIVGEISNPEYKVYSLSNGTIQTDNRIAESGSRYTNVTLTSNGVSVKRLFKDGHCTFETFDYEANDKTFKEKLIIKKYDTNNTQDQVTIGLKYLNGDGISKDASKAFEWFQKAAKQNNANGLYRLGYCYYNGIGVNRDKGEAASQYEKSANLGNKDAMEAVSKMYINGDGVTKDLSKALYWQEKLAFQGDKEAQKFVVANQSIEYEKTSISASEARDKALLGYRLKDYEWAEFCIKRAIDLGDNDARLDYGLWLAKGEGVLKDYSKAEEYLTFFAESGIAEAIAALSKIYLSLNDQKKALYWTEKAALQGDAEAQFTMAVHYENGVGVKKNAEAAFDMFKRAADNGIQEAIRRLVLAYGLGKGVKKDYNASVSYFDKLDLPTASLLANNVFWGENGMKKNKTLGLLLLHRAGYRGDKRSAELWEIYNK